MMKSSNGWKLLPPHDDYSWSCERYGSGVICELSQPISWEGTTVVGIFNGMV